MLARVKLYSLPIIKLYCSDALELLNFTRLVGDETESE